MEHSDVYSYIPDPEEFEEVGQREEASETDSDENNSLSSPSLSRQHPAWTWDCLTSEFAYRFQFQMLAGTPNLAYFSVGINSFLEKHKRTVGISDLIRPGFRHPAVTYVLDMGREQQEERKRLPYWDPEAYHPLGEEDGEEDEEAAKEKEDEEDEIWQEFEFLQISVMKDFFLIGPWMFDYRALKVLFGKVAPNIENLSLQGCYGFTVSEWVQSTSEHLHSLKSGFASIRFIPQLVAEAGLIKDKTKGRYGRFYKLTERPSSHSLRLPPQLSTKSAPKPKCTFARSFW
ncbi:hypothetical protein BGX24_006421 [Mortierella sp. AD032]|nr:hypothetical protein BGX24_006421 [Mortierella sp. AD032]